LPWPTISYPPGRSAAATRGRPLRSAGRLGGRATPEAAWEYHATCEGLAALELRSALRPEDGQRLWHDTLSALVAGWQQVTPQRDTHRNRPGTPARP